MNGENKMRAIKKWLDSSATVTGKRSADKDMGLHVDSAVLQSTRTDVPSGFLVHLAITDQNGTRSIQKGSTSAVTFPDSGSQGRPSEVQKKMMRPGMR
jgi:hypothetical protein